MLVYLAGPIAGVHQWEARNWRAAVGQAIMQTGHVAFHPDAAFSAPLEATAKDLQEMHSVRIGGLVENVNRAVIRLSGAVIASVMPAASVGTCREIEFARSLGRPVLVLMGDDRALSHSLWDCSVLTFNRSRSPEDLSADMATAAAKWLGEWHGS